MSEVRGLRLEVAEGVAVLTIDRPEARNAIGLATIGALEAVLDELGASNAQVVVVRGAGDRAFVSGGDLKELAAIRSEDQALEMAVRMRRVLDRLATLPMPVIAAINGHALGGGAEVAIAADIRVAAADIRIGFTQAKLGIMPAWGGAERLVQAVGRSRALLLVATGETLAAEEAKAIGLVDVVYGRPDFEAGWRTLAAGLAALPAGAPRSMKAVIAAVAPSHHPEHEPEAVRAFARLWVADSHWAAAEAASASRRRAPE
jgi:enoyl-CoA hydratase/carnithine racemase